MQNWVRNWVRNNKGFLVFLTLLGVFRTAVADWNPIPSGSMRPGLLEGDVVFVNRLAFNVKVPLTDMVLAHTGEPRRGDVVTFSSPVNGTRLIKRIMALPGDVVEMRNEQLIINGQHASYIQVEQVLEPHRGELTPALRFDESFGGHSQRIQVLPVVAARRSFGPVKVPADQTTAKTHASSDSSRAICWSVAPCACWSRLTSKAIGCRAWTALACRSTPNPNWLTPGKDFEIPVEFRL